MSKTPNQPILSSSLRKVDRNEVVPTRANHATPVNVPAAVDAIGYKLSCLFEKIDELAKKLDVVTAPVPALAEKTETAKPSGSTLFNHCVEIGSRVDVLTERVENLSRSIDL